MNTQQNKKRSIQMKNSDQKIEKISKNIDTLSAMDNVSIIGTDPLPKQTTVRVTNLPYDGTYLIDLLVHFEQFGDVKNIVVPRNEDKTCRGSAYVHFATEEEALKAVANEYYWHGNRAVKVCLW